MFAIIYRTPENPIKVRIGLTRIQLIIILNSLQDEVIRLRDAYDVPDAELEFVTSHEEDFGVGKDNSVWPAWKALITDGMKIIVPKIAIRTKTYTIS